MDQTFSASGSVLATDTETKTFDPVTGGVTSITTPSGTINYAYDPATGNHVETWTDSNQTLYGYNALGQLSTVTVTELNGTNLATPQVTTYTDDYNGNLKTVAQADGVTTTYTFDKLNRLTTEVATGSTGAVVASYVYTLASDGSRLSVLEHQEETNGTFSDVQVSYEYDGDGRLTREFDDASSGTSASGQPIFSTTGVPDSAGDFCDSYTYDLASNRVSKTHVTTAGTETTTNTYNADDQLTKSVDSVSGTSTYAYDPNGSQTNDGAHKYVYDQRNRLVEVTDESNNAIASYTDDDAGNRVSETTGGSGGTTTFYVIDANNPSGYPKPIEQWVSATGSRADATLVVSYILGSAVIGQADSSGTVSYLLTDGHGSTRALLSSSGVVMKTFNYDAYGNAVGFDPATAGTAWLFGGDGMYDAPSGLTFHGSGRQTDSETGLFVEADPPGHGSNDDPISLHKYLYANADPTNMDDPSGHDGELAELEISETIGETIDADSDVATEEAGKRAASGDIYNVYLGVEPGTKSGGGGIASGGILPHAFIYVDNRFTHSGMAYDVGGTGVFVDETTLSDVKARPSILLYVTEFNLPQYVTWTAETYVLSTVAGNLSKLDESGLIAAASTVHFPFSSSIISFLNPNTVNCYKFTAVAAFSAWVIGL